MLRWIRDAASWLRGRPRLGAFALRLVPDARVELRLAYLGPFVVRLRRNRAFWLRDPEEFEYVPFRVLQHLIRPGDVVADVGANMGLYARFVSDWTRAGRTLAFEPWLENCRYLETNLELGGVAHRVEVFPCALGDVTGEVDFQIDDIQSASGSLDRVKRGEPSEGRANLNLPPRTGRVTCQTLDGLIAAGRIPAPEVLKIDVEGAEALVLAGAQRLFEDRHPRVMIELHGAAEAHAALGFLFDRGYQVVGWGASEGRSVQLSSVGRSDLSRIVGRYDLNFVAASADGGLPVQDDLLRSPFEPEFRQVNE